MEGSDSTGEWMGLFEYDWTLEQDGRKVKHLITNEAELEAAWAEVIAGRPFRVELRGGPTYGIAAGREGDGSFWAGYEEQSLRWKAVTPPPGAGHLKALFLSYFRGDDLWRRLLSWK